MPRRLLTLILLFCLLPLSAGQAGLPQVYAGEVFLPVPGTMVSLSHAYNPPVLRGIKVNPNNPFKFDFILDKLFIAPGNAGTEKYGTNVDMKPTDFKSIKKFERPRNSSNSGRKSQ